jgi:NAD(P)H-dependent FMN reductase
VRIPHAQEIFMGKYQIAATALAQQHLRDVLACLDVPVLGQPEAFFQAKERLFDAAGSLGTVSKSTCKAGWTSALPG